MDLIIPILFMIFGGFVFYITYKDGEKREVELTTGYIMHLSGYFGGIGFFIMGLMMIFKIEFIDLIKILIPLGLTLGFYIKLIKKENEAWVKNYWKLLAVICFMWFLFSLFRYLKIE